MKKIFVNGTFDILHDGHLQLLNYAKSLGASLAVAIDSDARVKLLKGEESSYKHINKRRANMLINLKAVDEVYIFDTDEELKHLVSIHNVMVKGADYKDKPVIGSDVCKELIFFEIIDGYSTTKKIQDITTR
jgi:rfaE bifunctional protein nucleotidyltransferase chain/domain